MEGLLRGFNQQEVFDMYKYLCIYENKISILKNLAEVYHQYPQLKDLEVIMTKFTINYANDETMQALGVFIPHGFVYCTNTRSSKVYNFLYHLRNSIAHGQIQKDNGQVSLIDYKLINKKKKIFSGRGNLESSIIFNIIKLINNVVGL